MNTTREQFAESLEKLVEKFEAEGNYGGDGPLAAGLKRWNYWKALLERSTPILDC